MRGGLSGFLIFIACIALGVAAIGGVNSVARAITAGVESQGQSLLGGDMRFQLVHRETDAREATFLSSLGDVAHSANMRSMARLADGSDQTLVEVKAVDGLYPLYGAFTAAPALPLAELLGSATAPTARSAPTSCSTGWASPSATGSCWAGWRSNCAAASSANPTPFPTGSASHRACWSRSTRCALPA